MAAIARSVSDTMRTEVTLTRDAAGEDQSAVRVSVPARRSRTRSWECSVPYRMSNGSSSTSSRISLPLVTLMTVWPAVGEAVAGLRVRQRPDLVEELR